MAKITLLKKIKQQKSEKKKQAMSSYLADDIL